MIGRATGRATGRMIGRATGSTTSRLVVRPVVTGQDQLHDLTTGRATGLPSHIKGAQSSTSSPVANNLISHTVSVDVKHHERRSVSIGILLTS